MMFPPHLLALIDTLSSGYQEVFFNGRRYGLTRRDFNQGRSLKVFAEELGGTDYISFNLYETSTGIWLKPCEMPDAKVLSFLQGMETVPS